MSTPTDRHQPRRPALIRRDLRTVSQEMARRARAALVSSWAIAVVAAWPSGATAAPASPSQASILWTEIDLLIPAGPHAAIEPFVEAGLGANGPNPAFVEGGVLLDVRLRAWTLSAGAQWGAARTGAGPLSTVPRPVAEATYDGSLGPVSIEDTNRFEILEAPAGADSRYRNRLFAAYPLAYVAPVRSLFASDEVFYDFARRGWSENRAKLGLEFAAPGGRLQVYYGELAFRYARPSRLNVIGLTYQHSFR
jgi:hypothetical protein